MVAGQPNCEVFDPTNNASGVITTQELGFETTGTNSAAIFPIEGELLAVIHVRAKSGKTCNAEGTLQVNGFAEGTTEGDELVVADETDLNVDGLFPATLEGRATLEAGESGVHHPAALT